MQFSRCSKLRDDVLDPGRRVRLYPIIALNIYIKRVQDVAGSNLPRNHLWKVLLIDSLLYSPMYVRHTIQASHWFFSKQT